MKSITASFFLICSNFVFSLQTVLNVVIVIEDGSCVIVDRLIVWQACLEEHVVAVRYAS